MIINEVGPRPSCPLEGGGNPIGGGGWNMDTLIAWIPSGLRFGSGFSLIKRDLGS
jgi:hypothetical protein